MIRDRTLTRRESLWALAAAIPLISGCGEDPSRQAGTIKIEEPNRDDPGAMFAKKSRKHRDDTTSPKAP
ncbi:hypothetical protein [Aquisphaera insulae]|uniref:hypothetical protein n=1 Tax=Aquisphaera insulae TaxID=2712864 RepID=UPI0013EA24E3|nr:hypothetical protein [Aquisphaera insulae]